MAADFERPALVYVTPEWYRQTEVAGFYQVPDTQRFPLLERNLQAATDFYLFNQDFWGWYGMWEFGDFQHAFYGGYGWISQKPENPGERLRGILDYFPQYGWCYDNGRWGWCNTEGLESLWLQNAVPAHGEAGVLLRRRGDGAEQSRRGLAPRRPALRPGNPPRRPALD